MTSPVQQPADEKKQGSKASKRHPLRKWLVRVAVVFFSFLIVVVIGVQIVLRSGLPRSIVVSLVEKGLGLRMAVTSLSTGWLGHTSLHDVKIALPLSEQAFFDVPEMKVDHTSLLALIFGADVQIKGVELDKPVLYVRQNAAGQWNVQEVLELLARAGGKKTGQDTQTTPTPALPRLKIVDMTIVVLDNKNRSVRVEPINVNGESDTPVSYKYDIEIPSQQANVPPHLSLLGRVAPSALWQHEATIWIHDIVPFVRPWLPAFNQPVAFHGTWTGGLQAKGLTGFLQIKDSTVGNYHLDGALGAAQNDDGVAISPDNLHLSMSDPTQPDDAAKQFMLTVPRGTIDYNGKVVRATQVQLSLLGGPATFNGWFEPDINQGALEAYWQNLVVPQAGITQSGKLNLTFSRPVAAPLLISLSASTSGSARKSPFSADIRASVTGIDFSNLTWQISAPQLAYYRPPEPVILNGITASGAYRYDTQQNKLSLDRLSLPADNRLAASGSYDFSTREGKLHAEGQDWPLHLVEGTKLAFLVDASAKGVPSTTNPKKNVPDVELSQFVLRSGESSLTLKGTYDARRPKPVNAYVSFVNAPGTTAAAVETPTLLHGYVLGTANLVGTLEPRAIDISGALKGRGAEVLGHPVGDMNANLVGSIDEEKATIRADGIPFLDGIWNLGATYVTELDGNPVYETTVDLSVDHLPLHKVSEFLHQPVIDGVFAGHWYVGFPGLNPEATQIGITGAGKIHGLAASYLVADEVTFTTSMKDGIFKIDPIRLTRGNYGKIEASAQLAISQWRQLTASVAFSAFPIEIPSAAVGLQLWGGSSAINIYLPDAKSKDADAQKLRATTDLNIRTVVAINNQPEGEIRTIARMQGRAVNLKSTGDILGGAIAADAAVDIDHLPTQTRANITWKDLQSDRVVRLYPEMKGLGGTYSGSAVLQPATVGRPLEPLAVDVYSSSAKGHFRAIAIGDAELHAFIGDHRLIASDARASTFHVAGGAVDYWFASSGHIDTLPLPNGQEKPIGITVSNQLNLTLRSLNIDQFVSAVDPGHKPGFGRLGGELFLLSAPQRRTLSAGASATTAPTTGPAAAAQSAAKKQEALRNVLRSSTLDGMLAIADSDMGNYGPIAALYNLMHLGINSRSPTGYGTIALHMEQGILHISDFHYFNRGIEIRGIATVPETWKLEKSPIEGAAFGTVSPLKNIKLPLFAELDAVLTGLQKSVTTEEFKGTVENPIKDYVRPVSLSQLGSELRGILLGEIGENRQQ
jgi:hypothetical protein